MLYDSIVDDNSLSKDDESTVDNDSFNDDDSYDDDSYDNDDASYHDSLSDDGEERTRHVSELESKILPCAVFDNDYRDESRSLPNYIRRRHHHSRRTQAPTRISRSRINVSATSYKIRPANAWRRDNAAIKIQARYNGYHQRLDKIITHRFDRMRRHNPIRL